MPFDGFVQNTQVTERLVIGRARIDAGWCQGRLSRARRTWYGEYREYCLIGAVREGLPGWSVGCPDMAFDVLGRAIVDLGHSQKSLAVFNDFPGRTKAQVIEVVDLAIAMSRGERHQC